MDTTTLRRRLTDILNEEERQTVNWELVQNLCLKLSDELDKHPDLDCPHIVYHFLSDADVREKDEDYGRGQRSEIRRFADTGECEDSKPVSRRSCFALAIAIVCVAALLIWILR